MGQRNVVIDWDLPTFEEKLLECSPLLANALEEEARLEMYQWLYVEIVRIDAGISLGTLHLRDRSGRLLDRFDQWLAAASAGEWPPDVA